MSIVLDALLDAFLDCLKDLPFLFVAFLLLEILEHHVSEKMNRALAGAGGLGPLAGALLGCVPQCGFSIMAAEFYAGGVISLGTLLAVFLSTSDEAVIILLSNPSHVGVVGKLILTKVIIGILAGYVILIVGRFLRRRQLFPGKSIERMCGHCGCHEDGHGILIAALRHTGEVVALLFVFTFFLNLLLELVGMEQVSRMLLADSAFQPVLAALIGLIPSCAASVILTQLFIDGIISFGAAIAGLCSAAGMGLIVLFRMNPSRKESFLIAGLLFAISTLAGVVLQFAGI